MTANTSIEGYSKDERMWGMLCHLTAFAAFVGIPSFVGPLVIWLIKKEEYPFVDDQGKESLNFQLSMWIYGLICIPLIFVFFLGLLLLFALGIAGIILVIMASLKANEGIPYRYPFTIRLIK